MISSGNTIANLILVKLLDALIIELGLKIGLMTFGGIVFNIGHFGCSIRKYVLDYCEIVKLLQIEKLQLNVLIERSSKLQSFQKPYGVN